MKKEVQDARSIKFNTWNVYKQKLDKRTFRKTFNERDVFFMSVGENIGFEQNGKGDEFLRPVLVYKKFSTTTFLGIPLTRTNKDSRFYASFFLKKQRSTAILSQIRLFDAKRITYFYCRISVGNFKKIKEKLITLLQ